MRLNHVEPTNLYLLIPCNYILLFLILALNQNMELYVQNMQKNYQKVVILLDKSETELKQFLTSQFEKYPSNTIQSGLIWPIKSPVIVGLILDRLYDCARDDIKRGKIEFIRKSVQEVAVEVNKTFPLDYFDPSLYYKALGFIICGISVAGFIYLYFKRIHR